MRTLCPVLPRQPCLAGRGRRRQLERGAPAHEPGSNREHQDCRVGVKCTTDQARGSGPRKQGTVEQLPLTAHNFSGTPPRVPHSAAPVPPCYPMPPPCDSRAAPCHGGGMRQVGVVGGAWLKASRPINQLLGPLWLLASGCVQGSADNRFLFTTKVEYRTDARYPLSAITKRCTLHNMTRTPSIRSVLIAVCIWVIMSPPVTAQGTFYARYSQLVVSHRPRTGVSTAQRSIQNILSTIRSIVMVTSYG